MEVEIAENAGTCFGVENAIKKALDSVKNCKEKVHILGEIVHNPFVVKKLNESGVKEIKSTNELKEGTNLIIRAHGELKSVYDYCKEKNIEIIDCTCPFVKKAQNIATDLEKEGHQVVIIGDPEHPEVRGILARTDNAFAVKSPEDIKEKKVKYGKLGILSQTTQTHENFTEIVARIVRHSKIIKVYNTICTATEERQISAKKLAKEVDLMIVVGGKNSSNTKRLHQLCSKTCESKWIQDPKEIDSKWFEGIKKVGITGGASTPKEIIQKLAQDLRDNY